MKIKKVIKKVFDFKNKIKLFIIIRLNLLKTKIKEIFKSIVLFLYNSYVKVQKVHHKTKQYLEYSFFNSLIFNILFISFLIGFSVTISCFLKWLEISISADALSGLASSIGSLIGGAIAIVFTLSTFILQSTADLFSTQYLNKFINNSKEKWVFFILVLFSITSFVISFISDSGIESYYLFAVLLFVVSYSFYLIYVLYKDLRRMINPETTLIKIANQAILELQKVKKSLSLSAKLQGFIYGYNEDEKSLLLDTQYRSYSVWKANMLFYVKQLYEISLRLLSKNEIETTKLAIKFIHDIHAKHLELRNGNFVKIPTSTLPPVYTFDDQGFTTDILELLESYANRVLQDNRKENIYHLLQVYQSMFFNGLNVEFAKIKTFDNNNPVASLIIGYYKGFADNIIATKDINAIWELIKTTKNIQQIILGKNNDPLLLETIDSILEASSFYFLENKTIQARSSFTSELVQILLDRIILSWDKYSYDNLFWKRLFKNLKKHLIVSVSVGSSLDLSISNTLIHFRSWQTNLINSIFEIKDEEVRKEKLSRYLNFLENWSDFWLDFARDFGLQGNPLCLQIIMSTEQNADIVNFIEGKTGEKLDKIYQTQFNTLSWYFHKTKSVENYYSVELTNLFRFLILEIIYNLENKIKPEITNNIIDLYIQIIDDLFEKVEDSYGFDLPRVTTKLVPLGLVLGKYSHKYQQKVINKIIELNNKYLEKNKEAWNLQKEKFGKISSPDEHRLCYEISELKEDVFSYNAVRFDVEEILNREITEEQWQAFIGKIDYCKDIEYITRSVFPSI